MLCDEVESVREFTYLGDRVSLTSFEVLAADNVGSQNFKTFSTRQTPHLGD